MANGTVKWFSEKKGLGFIRQENGEDVFAHLSDSNGIGHKSLSIGDCVKFDVVEGVHGPAVTNVTLLNFLPS